MPPATSLGPLRGQKIFTVNAEIRAMPQTWIFLLCVARTKNLQPFARVLTSGGCSVEAPQRGVGMTFLSTP